MAITTKKGDRGRTSLYWGTRISKNHIRVEVFGVMDELCSQLGMAKSLIEEMKTKKLIESIQQDLFVTGAEIATTAPHIRKLERRMNKGHVDRLEEIIQKLESEKKFEECCFYLPGQNLVSSSLDIARTVARKAERRAVTLKNKKMLKNRYVLMYLNRLSDLLYLLSRSYETKSQKLAYK